MWLLWLQFWLLGLFSTLIACLRSPWVAPFNVCSTFGAVGVAGALGGVFGVCCVCCECCWFNILLSHCDSFCDCDNGVWLLW